MPDLSHLDPTQVTAWATVALALVGIISIVANSALAFVTWKMSGDSKRAAKAAEDSVTLGRDELKAVERQLQLVEEERGREAHDRRAAQARLVSAWWSGEGGVDPKPEGQFVLPVIVRNGSTEPVYGVVVQLVLGVRGTFVRNVYTLGPFETRQLPVASPGYPHGMPAPSIVFTDAVGTVWLRDGYGRLSNPSAEVVEEHSREDPGAYEKNPELDQPRTPSESRGTAIRWPPIDQPQGFDGLL